MGALIETCKDSKVYEATYQAEYQNKNLKSIPNYFLTCLSFTDFLKPKKSQLLGQKLSGSFVRTRIPGLERWLSG